MTRYHFTARRADGQGIWRFAVTADGPTAAFQRARTLLAGAGKSHTTLTLVDPC